MTLASPESVNWKRAGGENKEDVDITDRDYEIRGSHLK
jgi:hypothetical protein